MPRRTLSRALMVIIAGVMLSSMAPATAGAIGTTTTVKPISRPVVMEAPSDGAGREVRGAQGMSLLLCIDGVILGLPLGLLLGYRVLRRCQGRKGKQRDIDRLTAQFQALFRAIDQGKKPYP